jgi:hypothetical protein
MVFALSTVFVLQSVLMIQFELLFGGSLHCIQFLNGLPIYLKTPDEFSCHGKIG